MKKAEMRARNFNGYANKTEEYRIRFENAGLSKRLVEKSPTISFKAMEKDFAIHKGIVNFRKELFKLRKPPDELHLKPVHRYSDELGTRSPHAKSKKKQ